MKPTIGRIVLYRVSQADQEELRSNSAKVLPAVVVYAFTEECVNLQVFCDGPVGTVWKISIMQGKEAGQWDWPAIIPGGEVVVVAAPVQAAELLRQRARDYANESPEASPEIGTVAALDELVAASYEQAAQIAELIASLRENPKKK